MKCRNDSRVRHGVSQDNLVVVRERFLDKVFDALYGTQVFDLYNIVALTGSEVSLHLAFSAVAFIFACVGFSALTH